MGARRGALAVLAGLVVGALGAPGTAAAEPGDAGIGYDVSYPQCGQPLPAVASFGVVGVNGGLATTVTRAWRTSWPGRPGSARCRSTSTPPTPGSCAAR